MKEYRLYLDVCCLNRPFDDWTQDRIRLEAEAVLAIASRCQSGEWQLVSSTALESEISRTPDVLRRQRVLDSLSLAASKVIVTPSLVARAQELTALSFKSFDALHIACAESARVSAFLTTDDRVFRKAQTHAATIKVTVSNPVTWLMEVSTTEGENEHDPD